MIVRMKSPYYYDVPPGLIGLVLYDFKTRDKVFGFVRNHYYVVKWPIFVCEVAIEDVEVVD